MGYFTLDKTLTAIQSLSALSFGGFLLLHIPASAASVISQEQATQLMLIGRELYQSDLLEPLFLGSAVIHISSGFARRIHRHGLRSVRSLSLHAASGYLLIPFVSFHVYLHRYLPLQQHVAEEISYSFTTQFLQQYSVLAWAHYSLFSGPFIFFPSARHLTLCCSFSVITCLRRHSHASVREKQESSCLF